METNRTSKTCPKCNRHLPLSSTHWHRRKDGWQHYCKACQTSMVRASQQANQAHYTAYSARRYQDMDVVRRKHICRALANKMVAHGELVKPETCGVCGQIPAKRIEGHHWHYDYPGIVSWTCTECHPKLDEMQKNMRPAEAALLCKVFAAED